MVHPWRAAVSAVGLAALTFAGDGVTAAPAAADDVSFTMSFSDYQGGSALKWLADKGFEPKRDADNQSRVTYSSANGGLVLETRRQAQAVLLHEANVLEYSKVRIEWGVETFPPGASYLKGVRSEAIMVLIFFGDKKLSSGSLLIPDSPYFIGLNLCETDPIGQAFTGRYFKIGGRYICASQPKPGETVVTEHPIAETFTRLYGQQAPDISGLGLAIDTDATRGNGVAKAFIKSIQFIK